jgi:TRAP-type C4-dicarboxylate transport system substrate-binding protein
MRLSSYLKILCASLAIILFAANAHAANLVLTHSGAPGSLYDISAREFVRRANARLPEDHLISLAPDPERGTDHLEAVKQGEVTMALLSSEMLAVSDLFAIFELPYLIRTRTQVRGLRKAIVDPYLQPAAEANDLHILGVWENGFHHITNDLQPIAHPKDFKGVRIAVEGNSWREKTFLSFGATPAPVPSATVKGAAQDRPADGLDAPLNEIEARNLLSSQRFLTLSDHIYSPAFLVVRKGSLDALPPEVREILAAEAQEMEIWIQAMAIRIESNLLDRLDLNMNVAYANVTTFELMTRPLYGQYIRNVPEGINLIIAISSTKEQTAANQ